MTNEPLDLELSFDRLRNGDEHLGNPDSATAEAEWELYDLGLIDHTRSTAYPNIDEIRFRPDEQIPGLGISARKFTSLFAAPGTLTLEDGLRFGAWLEELLFPTTTRSTRAEAEPLRDTWQSLRAIDDHFGQALALLEVFEALRARNNGPAALAALMLAWAERKVIDDPQAESLAQMLGKVFENFDAQVVAPSLLDNSRSVLEAAITECAAELEAAGVDPLSPLADRESPPDLGASP